MGEVIPFKPRPQPPKEAQDAVNLANRHINEARRLLSRASNLCEQAGVPKPMQMAFVPPKGAA